MFRIREVFGVELPMGLFYAEPALAECAAAIEAARSATAPGSAGRAAPGVIGRRSRAGYQVGINSAAAAPTAASSGPSADSLAVATETAPPVAAPAGSSGIARRDRGAFRVATPPAAGPASGGSAEPASGGSSETGPGGSGEPSRTERQLAPHLVPMTGDWALWREVTLRAAGFPLDLLEALGDPGLAALADAANAAQPDRPKPPMSLSSRPRSGG